MAETISIVIAAESDPAVVQRNLASLPREPAVDIHVARAAEARDIPAQERLTVHAVRGETTRTALRAAGFAAAQGEAIAVLNEDYTVPPDWLAAVRSSARHSADVVCGEVRSPPGSSLASRAAYLWEYSHLLPPSRTGELPPAEARWIPAGCAVYRGRARDARWLQDAAGELAYHAAMADTGVKFHRDTSLFVYYNPPPLGRFLNDRRRWSREWAQSEIRKNPPRSGVGAALSRLALFPVLLGRLAVRVARRPKLWITWVLATPLFLAFAWVQTAGEFSAYIERDPA